VTLRMAMEDIGRADLQRVGTTATLFLEDTDDIVLAAITMDDEEAIRAEAVIRAMLGASKPSPT
jgi:hypothetical protein